MFVCGGLRMISLNDWNGRIASGVGLGTGLKSSPTSNTKTIRTHPLSLWSLRRTYRGRRHSSPVHFLQGSLQVVKLSARLPQLPFRGQSSVVHERLIGTIDQRSNIGWLRSVCSG